MDRGQANARGERGGQRQSETGSNIWNGVFGPHSILGYPPSASEDGDRSTPPDSGPSSGEDFVIYERREGWLPDGQLPGRELLTEAVSDALVRLAAPSVDACAASGHSGDAERPTPPDGGIAARAQLAAGVTAESIAGPAFSESATTPPVSRVAGRTTMLDVLAARGNRRLGEATDSEATAIPLALAGIGTQVLSSEAGVKIDRRLMHLLPKKKPTAKLARGHLQAPHGLCGSDDNLLDSSEVEEWSDDMGLGDVSIGGEINQARTAGHQPSRLAPPTHRRRRAKVRRQKHPLGSLFRSALDDDEDDEYSSSDEVGRGDDDDKAGPAGPKPALSTLGRTATSTNLTQALGKRRGSRLTHQNAAERAGGPMAAVDEFARGDPFLPLPLTDLVSYAGGGASARAEVDGGARPVQRNLLLALTEELPPVESRPSPFNSGAKIGPPPVSSAAETTRHSHLGTCGLFRDPTCADEGGENGVGAVVPKLRVSQAVALCRLEEENVLLPSRSPVKQKVAEGGLIHSLVYEWDAEPMPHGPAQPDLSASQASTMMDPLMEGIGRCSIHAVFHSYIRNMCRQLQSLSSHLQAQRPPNTTMMAVTSYLAGHTQSTLAYTAPPGRALSESEEATSSSSLPMRWLRVEVVSVESAFVSTMAQCHIIDGEQTVLSTLRELDEAYMAKRRAMLLRNESMVFEGHRGEETRSCPPHPVEPNNSSAARLSTPPSAAKDRPEGFTIIRRRGMESAAPRAQEVPSPPAGSESSWGSRNPPSSLSRLAYTVVFPRQTVAMLQIVSGSCVTLMPPFYLLQKQRTIIASYSTACDAASPWTPDPRALRFRDALPRGGSSSLAATPQATRVPTDAGQLHGGSLGPGEVMTCITPRAQSQMRSAYRQDSALAVVGRYAVRTGLRDVTPYSAGPSSVGSTPGTSVPQRYGSAGRTPCFLSSSATSGKQEEAEVLGRRPLAAGELKPPPQVTAFPQNSRMGAFFERTGGSGRQERGNDAVLAATPPVAFSFPSGPGEEWGVPFVTLDQLWKMYGRTRENGGGQPPPLFADKAKVRELSSAVREPFCIRVKDEWNSQEPESSISQQPAVRAPIRSKSTSSLSSLTSVSDS